MKLIYNNIERGYIIFKVLCGSHAHGTNIPESDMDYKGVYLQSPQSVLELGYQEQVEVSKDETYYELKRFIELCCTNNPTMLEVLFSPEDCIIYKDDVFNTLLGNKEKFLSKSCKYSFGGYAKSQIEKASGLEKKMNWEKSDTERKDILDFCNVSLGEGKSQPFKVWGLPDYTKYAATSIPNMKDCYALFYNDNFKGIADEKSNQIKLTSIPKEYVHHYVADMHFNLDSYSRHCKKYKEYQEWLKTRNVQRYVDIDQHGQKIDGKNMLHCMRLIEVSKEIAEGKGFNVRRPNAEYLISIRKGQVDLTSLLEKATLLLEETDKLYETSNLPHNCDKGYFLSMLSKIRKEYYEKTI